LSFRVSKNGEKEKHEREERKKKKGGRKPPPQQLLFIKRHISARVDEKKTMRKTRGGGGGGGGTTVAVRMVAPKKKSVSFVKSRDEFSTKRRGGKRSPLAEMSMNEKDDDEERDSPMTARRKWNKEQRGANEKTMGTRWKATAMDKVLILTRRVESLEVREFWSFFLSLSWKNHTVNERSSSSV